jgi:hypothetical protein
MGKKMLNTLQQTEEKVKIVKFLVYPTHLGQQNLKRIRKEKK